MKREKMNEARRLLDRIERAERLRELADKEVRVYVGGTGSGDTSVALSPQFLEVLWANIKSTLNMRIKQLTAELEAL